MNTPPTGKHWGGRQLTATEIIALAEISLPYLLFLVGRSDLAGALFGLFAAWPRRPTTADDGRSATYSSAVVCIVAGWGKNR